METLKLVFTQFNHETLVILVSLNSMLFVFILTLWAINRRKYHQLLHQIPAGVVKSYLDTIIQNSTSLKSSLFRGGGQDAGAGIPSIMPIGGLGGGGDSEALNQKIAQITQLSGQLAEKTRIIQDLEKRVHDLTANNPAAANVSDLQGKISNLEKELAAAKASGGGGAPSEALTKEVADVKKERDDLKEKLKEYEIIDDDLANLKKLQKENEELKNQLKGLGGAGAQAVNEVEAATKAAINQPEPPPPPPPQEPTAPPAAPVAPPAAPTAAAPAEAVVNPELSGDQKSPEDLLAEFEKMLGQ